MKKILLTILSLSIVLLLFSCVKSYKFVLLSNAGGSVSGSENATYKDGDTIIASAYPDEGYSFLGWYANNELVNSNLMYSFSIHSDITLIGRFQLTEYTITYHIDDKGENSENNPDTYTILNRIVLENPTSNFGYKFVGWYSDVNYNNKISVIEKGSTGNINLYALYEETNPLEDMWIAYTSLTPPPGLLTFNPEPTEILDYEIEYQATGQANQTDFNSWLVSVNSIDITYVFLNSIVSNLGITIDETTNLGIHIYMTNLGSGPTMIYAEDNYQELIDAYISSLPIMQQVVAAMLFSQIQEFIPSTGANYMALGINIASML